MSHLYNPRSRQVARFGDYMMLTSVVPEPKEVFVRRLLFFLTLLVPGAATAQGPAPLPAWLAGCWEQTRGGSVSIEMWMAPAGGMMLGASRTVAAGTVREYEQIILRQEKGKLVYTAHPSGQAEASFTSTEVTDSAFAVANPQHDFPQKIIYRRRGADSLVARIEGPGPGGTRGIDYPMRKTNCGS